MRQLFRIVAVLLISSALAVSCIESGIDPLYLKDDNVSLRIDGNIVFTYNPLSCQLAFNRENCDFRVSTDNMSDYYRLKLKEIPSVQGQHIEGVLYWTNSSNVNRNECYFTVEKISNNGKAWLWDGKQNICVVVQILN